MILQGIDDMFETAVNFFLTIYKKAIRNQEG